MNRYIVLLAPLLAASMACPSWAADEEGASTPAAPAATAATADASCEPQRTLDDLDGRTAVPLLPRMANHQKVNMRDHLVAVQEIVAGMAAGDFAAIESASGRIGFSDQMARMCTHMGAGAPGFTEQALNFHRTADTITAAARQKDMPAVTKALGVTLQTCTGCHATFRQNVVDEATWSRITSMPPPGGPGPRPLGFGRGAGGQRRRCADPTSPDCPAGGPRGPGR